MTGQLVRRAAKGRADFAALWERGGSGEKLLELHMTSMIDITLKLFASVTDYLPLESKYANIVEMDIAPDTTIG